MGVNFLHYKDGKGSEQGAQEPGHLPKLLVKLYSFLARRTNSTFNQVVLKVLYMSHTNQLPLSLFLMMQKMRLPSQEDKTAVVARIITDDVCVQEVTKLKVCVLSVSSRARTHILQAGANPHLQLAGPECSQGLWHRPALLARAERCTGISAKPREPRTATPNPTCAPRTGSWSATEAEGPAATTKTNPRLCLVIKHFGCKSK